jgi:hypothetical protein
MKLEYNILCIDDELENRPHLFPTGFPPHRPTEADKWL